MGTFKEVILFAAVCVAQILASDTTSGLYGPNCVSCKAASDPAQCQDTVQCWASQQCYAERYMHADGHLLYDFGCKIKEECTLIEQNRGRKKRLDIAIDLCEECCHGELCNMNTCVNRTETAAMSCYACEEEGNPKDCHVLQQCKHGQVCYAEKVITDSPHPLFTLGCLSQQICNLLDVKGQTIFGRSLRKSRNKRATHLCQKCCSTPGCNAGLCETGEPTIGPVSTFGASTSGGYTSSRYTSDRYTSSQYTSEYVTTQGITTTSITDSSTSTMRSSVSTPGRVSVRLVGGNSPNEGRVEIFHNGQWGTVCDDGFSVRAASVVCHMLGLPRTEALVHPQAYYGSGAGTIWLDGVVCTGSENSISDCRSHGWGVNDCQHTEDVGVVCASSVVSVRLVNGHSPNEGRVELLHDGHWGTVCDDNFNNSAASVVCHMLGYPRTGAKAWGSAHFGSGPGPIWLDDVKCSGKEESLAECRQRNWGQNNCAHNEDAGVSCYAPQCMPGAVNFNSSCYVINPSDKVKSFDAAVTECHRLSAKLVTIDSLEEAEFLMHHLRNLTTGNTGEWLTGGQLTNGHWVWSGSGSRVDMDFISWGPGERTGQRCMSFWKNHNYRFADVNCDGFARNFICEKPLV